MSLKKNNTCTVFQPVTKQTPIVKYRSHNYRLHINRSGHLPTAHLPTAHSPTGTFTDRDIYRPGTFTDRDIYRPVRVLAGFSLRKAQSADVNVLVGKCPSQAAKIGPVTKHRAARSVIGRSVNVSVGKCPIRQSKVLQLLSIEHCGR